MNNYRLIHGHLYQKQGNAYMHVAVVPNRVRKSITRAVRWFEEDMDDVYE